MPELLVLLGPPAAGKTTWAAAALPGVPALRWETGYRTAADLEPGLERLTGPRLLVEHSFPTRAGRRPVLAAARARGWTVRAVVLETSTSDAARNAVGRMVTQVGRLPEPEELEGGDPALFRPGVIERWHRLYEAPTGEEGFDGVQRVVFPRPPAPQERTILLDYDGTLRRSRSGSPWPLGPEDVELLPGRRERLHALVADGWRLFGASNQGQVGLGRMTAAEVGATFRRTNDLLGLDIEVAWCPHAPAPIACWCRKPLPGLAIRLGVHPSLMVGDSDADARFAAGLGVPFEPAERFFG